MRSNLAFKEPVADLGGGRGVLRGVNRGAKLREVPQPSGGAYLDSVISSTIFEVDATISDSYSGSGYALNNLTASPADGEDQSDYDFYLGTDGIGGHIPTFTGTPGDSGAYFDYTGANQVVGVLKQFIDSGTSTTFLNSIHKTDQTDLEFWYAMTIYWPAAVTSGQYRICGNMYSTSEIGFCLNYELGNARITLEQASSTVKVDSYASGIVQGDAWNLFIYSFQKTSGTTGSAKFYLNGNIVTPSLNTFTTTTETPTKAMTLGSAAGGYSAELPVGARVVSCAMGNEFLSDSKMGDLEDYLSAAHSRTYDIT